MSGKVRRCCSIDLTNRSSSIRVFGLSPHASHIRSGAEMEDVPAGQHAEEPLAGMDNWGLVPGAFVAVASRADSWCLQSAGGVAGALHLAAHGPPGSAGRGP